MTTVNFKIHGDFLTEHCRNLVFEGNWRGAIKILVDGLPGLGYDNAIDIVKGIKRLEGVNEVDLLEELPETSTNVAKQQNSKYGGIFYDGSKTVYMKPYAYVTNWRQDDLEGPGKVRNIYHPFPRPGKFSADTSGDKYYRSLYYANNKKHDRVECLKLPITELGGKTFDVPSDAMVLWEKVEQPPLWIEIHLNMQLALDEYLKIESLELRGGHQILNFERTALHPASNTKDADTYAEMAATSGLPVEAIQSTLNFVQGKQDRASEPMVDKSLSRNHGWVHLDGRFFPCDFFEHDALAARIIQHLFNEKPPEGQNESEQRLETLGGVKIATSQLTGDSTITWGLDHKFSKLQWNTCFDWCDKHKIDYKSTGLKDLGEETNPGTDWV